MPKRTLNVANGAELAGWNKRRFFREDNILG
jgi:hypothetical protein